MSIADQLEKIDNAVATVRRLTHKRIRLVDENESSDNGKEEEESAGKAVTGFGTTARRLDNNQALYRFGDGSYRIVEPGTIIKVSHTSDTDEKTESTGFIRVKKLNASGSCDGEW